MAYRHVCVISDMCAGVRAGAENALLQDFTVLVHSSKYRLY